MSDNPSLAGNAHLGAQTGPARPAFQPGPNLGAPHLQPQHPPEPPPRAPVGSMQGGHLASQATADPFSRTIDLPSGGVFYPDGTRQVRIRPMRGEEELNVAGTSPEGPDRSRVMRETVAKCCTILGGTPLEELTVLDYAAISLHLMAATAGTDEINADASNGCGKEACPLASQAITMTSLPCTYLVRNGQEAEEEEEVDPVIAAAMRAEAKLAAQETGEEADPETWGFGRQNRAVGGSYREPFTAELPGGTVVQWRHLRVKDQIAAETFLLETGAVIDTQNVKAALASYLQARAIVAINGQKASPLMALQWWRKAPGPILRKLREKQVQHSFGYEFRPQFRCPRGACRKEVAVELPKDGSLFRPSRS